MIAGVASEKCFQRPHNVSSNPFPTMATHHRTSKISHFTFFSSLELSLLFQNARGDLDATGSM
jgi:hypothetical protein